MVTGYAFLLGVVAQDKWPEDFAFSDEAWKAQRDRLALGTKAKQFQELQAVYLALGALARTPLAERGDPVLYWPLLVTVDRALLALGESADVERAQLDNFRMPLEDRLAEIRTAMAEMRALPENGQRTLFDDAVAKALDNFPPELRAAAAEAFTRQRPGG
jgi:hypothetical protein